MTAIVGRGRAMVKSRARAKDATGGREAKGQFPERITAHLIKNEVS